MPERKTKCPDRIGHCSHDLVEHTAKGGCLHRKSNGAICGCTYTPGPEHGASPFAQVAPLPNGTTISKPPNPQWEAPTHQKKENTEMNAPTRLFNIAGVAAELNVTPQAASAWHRGPIETPAPSFVVDATGLELWTADDVTKWSDWVQAQEAEKRGAKEKRQAKPAEPAAEMPKAEIGDVDTPSTTDADEVPNGEPTPTPESGRNKRSA